MPAKPRFFASRAAFRKWLRAHHAKADELVVGFYKKGSGKPGVSYPEAVEEALCYGWIDGVRRSLDETSYTNRFTPRRKGSIWSAINRKKVVELEKKGLMRAAGRAAFRGRDPGRQMLYSFENRGRKMHPRYRQRFASHPRGWKYFREQPPWYQRTATWWVVSAKQEATRLRRLETLIQRSDAGVWIGPLKREK